DAVDFGGVGLGDHREPAGMARRGQIVDQNVVGIVCGVHVGTGQQFMQQHDDNRTVTPISRKHRTMRLNFHPNEDGT
ncbi:hypothetical protein, partial [Klebsiella pneumoniae]|uniref:hypothetical protein n=1 Tax=Klebsiella pneumoniae TaxID=573 RepID=UPI0027314382